MMAIPSSIEASLSVEETGTEMEEDYSDDELDDDDELRLLATAAAFGARTANRDSQHSVRSSNSRQSLGSQHQHGTSISSRFSNASRGSLESLGSQHQRGTSISSRFSNASRGSLGRADFAYHQAPRTSEVSIASSTTLVRHNKKGGDAANTSLPHVHGIDDTAKPFNHPMEFNMSMSEWGNISVSEFHEHPSSLEAVGRPHMFDFGGHRELDGPLFQRRRSSLVSQRSSIVDDSYEGDTEKLDGGDESTNYDYSHVPSEKGNRRGSLVGVAERRESLRRASLAERRESFGSHCSQRSSISTRSFLGKRGMSDVEAAMAEAAKFFEDEGLGDSGPEDHGPGIDDDTSKVSGAGSAKPGQHSSRRASLRCSITLNPSDRPKKRLSSTSHMSSNQSLPFSQADLEFSADELSCQKKSGSDVDVEFDPRRSRRRSSVARGRRDSITQRRDSITQQRDSQRRDSISQRRDSISKRRDSQRSDTSTKVSATGQNRINRRSSTRGSITLNSLSDRPRRRPSSTSHYSSNQSLPFSQIDLDFSQDDISYQNRDADLEFDLKRNQMQSSVARGRQGDIELRSQGDVERNGANPELGGDRRHFQRRVLSMPDPNAISHFSERERHKSGYSAGGGFVRTRRDFFRDEQSENVGKNSPDEPQSRIRHSFSTRANTLSSSRGNAPDGSSDNHPVGANPTLPSQLGSITAGLGEHSTATLLAHLSALSMASGGSSASLPLTGVNGVPLQYQEAALLSVQQQLVQQMAALGVPSLLGSALGLVKMPGATPWAQMPGMNGSLGNDTAEFDGRTTGVEAIDPQSNDDKNASRALHMAAEKDSPFIKNILFTCPAAARFLCDNPTAASNRDVAIHVAARKGNMAAINTLLETDQACALIRNAAGHVALHCAVKSGRFAAVQAICSRVPQSARVQCEEGILPLHEALSSAAHFQDSPQITAVVLGAFPEAAGITTDEGLLPIHYAAMSGSASGIRTLFATKFETIHERENTEGMNALDFAVDGWTEGRSDDDEKDQASVTGVTDPGEASENSKGHELLSVAWRQAPTKKNKSHTEEQFDACIEILLISTLHNRPVLSPFDEDEDHTFLPLHGAVAAVPLQRTWKQLLSMYGSTYGASLDRNHQTAFHFLLKLSTEIQDEDMIRMMYDLQAINPAALTHRDIHGMLPLHVAICASRSLAVVKELVKMDGSALSKEVDAKKQLGGLLPFQLAAVANCSVDHIYFLLRGYPMCMGGGPMFIP